MMMNWKQGAAIVGGATLLAAIWWLGSPLVLNRTVNEPSPAAMMKDSTVTMMEDSSDKMMEESSDETMKESPGEMDKTMDTPMQEMNMKPAAYHGTFMDGDSDHRATGTAQLVVADEKQYLRFENFSVTNGPDLFVYLTKAGMPVKDCLSLGPLKGNIGSQNYEIPSDTDLMTYSQVVIWCRSFNVTFGIAELMAQM